MITLINRQKVFREYPKIAKEISTMQRLFFDDDPECFASEEDREWYRQLFDAKDLFFDENEKYHSVLSFEHNDIKTYTEALSQRLLALLTELKITGLIMIAHYKMSFIGNIGHTYRPVQMAFKSLKEITNDVSYDEALIFGIEDLSKLIEIAFWIERCDAAAPEFIFFHDVDEKVAFNICKEGNVHFIEYENELLSDSLLHKHGWEFLDGKCSNKFSDSSKIEGRQTIR